MEEAISYFYSCIFPVSKLPGGVCSFHCQVLVIYKSIQSVSASPCAIQTSLAALEKVSSLSVVIVTVLSFFFFPTTD